MKCKHIVVVLFLSLLFTCGGCSRFRAEAVPLSEGPASGTFSAGSASGTFSAEPAETASPSPVPELPLEIESSAASPRQETDIIQSYLDNMSLEEKAAQLFIVLPEALMDGVNRVTAAGDRTRAAISEIPIGGFVYLGSNLENEEQVTAMLSNVQAYSMERIGLPAFLCVDEEGGSVARISGTGKFNVPAIEDMSAIGQAGELSEAYRVGSEMGAYLSRLGFNVDFAPVADVLSHPDNQVVRLRSFGSDSRLVSEMSRAVSDGLQEQGILSTYKHFPGHGATAGDTHKGYAYTDKSLEQLRACELLPFQDGIRSGVPFIMVGHISLPNIIGDQTPASLSPIIMKDLLRGEMGYDGVVITDALNMGAIVQQYSSADAAVLALQAGADMILMPADFRAAYAGVVSAMENGTLSQERIDESLTRILRLKLQLKNH